MNGGSDRVVLRREAWTDMGVVVDLEIAGRRSVNASTHVYIQFVR
jgi:hypothetical protein